MKYDLSKYVTVEQIDAFLAEFVANLKHLSQDPYDKNNNWGMREQEYNALEFLYSTFYDHLFTEQVDREYLKFIVRYDQTHPNATYVYYSGPTTSPDIVQTTLQQVLIDAVMFDCDLLEYAPALQNLSDAEFITISVTPSDVPLEYRP